jgi:hypothetical protein
MSKDMLWNSMFLGYTVKRYVMEFNVFLGYTERGIACLVNHSGHEQYPSNSLDQNNSAHGVTM